MVNGRILPRFLHGRIRSADCRSATPLPILTWDSDAIPFAIAESAAVSHLRRRRRRAAAPHPFHPPSEPLRAAVYASS